MPTSSCAPFRLPNCVISYHPGILIPIFFRLVSYAFSYGCPRTYDGDWDGRRIWEYEFDFFELLSPPPVLCQRDPACAAVPQAMRHDDGRCMPLHSGNDKRSGHHATPLFKGQRVSCSSLVMYCRDSRGGDGFGSV
jgi:hypothetical protein